MNKSIWWIIIAIVIVAIGIVIWQSGGGTLPEEEGPAFSGDVPEVGDDTTTSITENLEGIDLGDLESELEGIDEDLNQL